MHILDHPRMGLEHRPDRKVAQTRSIHDFRRRLCHPLLPKGRHPSAQLALRIAALLDCTQSIRSFHDLTKEPAPSSCRRAANAVVSMPALAKATSTPSLSPPSGESAAPTRP